jgi:hypothetical protein
MPSLKSPKLLNRSKLFNSSIVLLTAVFLSALVMSLFPRSGAAANNIRSPILAVTPIKLMYVKAVPPLRLTLPFCRQLLILLL